MAGRDFTKVTLGDLEGILEGARIKQFGANIGGGPIFLIETFAGEEIRVGFQVLDPSLSASMTENGVLVNAKHNGLVVKVIEEADALKEEEDPEPITD